MMNVLFEFILLLIAQSLIEAQSSEGLYNIGYDVKEEIIRSRGLRYVSEREKLDPASIFVQQMAREAAENAVAERERRNEICITTLDRSKLSQQEQGLLLFSAPPPFHEFPQTLKSWDNAVRGYGRLVIFTNDPETRRVCAENDVPTMCVEHTDEGLPRLDKMFERMQDSQPHGIVAYMNSDLLIDNFDTMHAFLQDLQKSPLEQRITTKIYEPFVDTGSFNPFWFVVASRINISVNGERDRHTGGGYDFWAWNIEPNGPPLLPFDVPPFRFPYATYDNWLLDVLVQSGQRNAVDASEVIDMFHLDHARVDGTSSWSEAFVAGKTGVYINRHLGLSEPAASLNKQGQIESPFQTVRYMLRHGTPNGCPYYVQKDVPSQSWNIQKRKYFSNLEEHDPEQFKCQGRPNCQIRKFIQDVTDVALDKVAYLPYADGMPSKSHYMKAAEENWRYTLDVQLKQHATPDGFVLLTAVNYAYREHLMNFKCTLERVGMMDHFVVAAMDEQMYKWGILQGLPIFLASTAKQHNLDSTAETVGGKFGSTGFRQVTKLKSRAVLEVLDAGYSVVWSDVDIMWFVHPFDALAGYMKKDGGIAIQSNAPFKANDGKQSKPHESVGFVETDDPAGFQRLNSGLYVAPNNELVRDAFREIVAHAAQSKLSEQPSFDYVLCARYPSERRYATCTYRPSLDDGILEDGSKAIKRLQTSNPSDNFKLPKELHVELLDRFMFPNGAILVGPTNKNVYVLGERRFSKMTGKPIYCAHNNWISGEDLKQARAYSAGWWFIDQMQSCTYPKIPNL